MSFDEVKKIMTDQGFTCIDETFGIDEIGAVSFSMDFTGDVKVFDIPVYSIQVFMENDGDALHIYFSFHSYSYETDDGNTVVYRTLLTVYEDIRKAMRNHYGEPNYLHNTWRDGLKYYELDEPLNMPGQPAKIFQLELESFERPDDPAEP